MKKLPYILLLIAEILVGLLFMGLMWSNAGWPLCAAVAAATAALLVSPIRKRKAAGDAAQTKKLRRQIVLVLLLPTAVGLAIGVYVLVSLFLYFG